MIVCWKHQELGHGIIHNLYAYIIHSLKWKGILKFFSMYKFYQDVRAGSTNSTVLITKAFCSTGMQRGILQT